MDGQSAATTDVTDNATITVMSLAVILILDLLFCAVDAAVVCKGQSSGGMRA
jgi:hypothetical protein